MKKDSGPGSKNFHSGFGRCEICDQVRVLLRRRNGERLCHKCLDDCIRTPFTEQSDLLHDNDYSPYHYINSNHYKFG
jgi:hypothetical protein